MMEVTDIHIFKQKVVIFFNDIKLEITPETYTEFNLYLHKKIDEKLFKQITEFNQYSKNLSYAINLINRYAYTTLKLTNKLIAKEIPREQIDCIINYLTEHRLLNDEEFAISYARALSVRHKGSYFIKDRLRTLGVSETNIEKALKNVDNLSSIKVYIKSLDDRYSKTHTINKMNKIINACLRSGYSNEEINKTLKTLPLTKINVTDALNKDYQKFKRQYDDVSNIIKALKRKGYSYSKIKAVIGEDYDFH